MTYIAGNILIPKLFKSRDEGRQFLELLLRHLPSHVPEFYGKDEPLRRTFLAKELDAVLNEWGHFCFAAECKKPRFWVSLWYAAESVPNPFHTSVHLRMEAKEPAHVSAFRAFVTEVAVRFDADLAVAHILTASELAERVDDLRREPGGNPAYIIQRAEKVGTAETLDGMTVMQYKSKNVRSNLPDLCWLTVFGRPYVELFGRDRLLSAPAYEAIELPNGSILMNVSKDLVNTPESWQTFKEIRDECKNYLNSNVFFEHALPRNHVYRVPKFWFPIEMYRARIVS